MRLKVEIEINGDETAVQSAFAEFLLKAAKAKSETPKSETPKNETPKNEEPETVQPVEEKQVVARKKEAKAKIEEPKVEEKKAEEKKAEEASGIDINVLRKMVSERAANHRDALKAKLAELGAANVSTLDEAKFEEFHNFLTTLA